MFRISFSFLLIFSLAIATLTTSVQAFNQNHVNKLVTEKKRVKDLRGTLASEIAADTLTDDQKRALVPKCLECDLSRYDFSAASDVCVTTQVDGASTTICEDLTNLKDFDLTGSTLTEANLKSVNLRDANLRQTNAVEAKFNDGDLRGANLSNATISQADFACANMGGVLIGSSAANGAKFTGVDMSEARIIFSDMCATDLTNTNLSDSHIEAVNMAVARVKNTNFTNARMYVTMKDATALFAEYRNTPQAQLAFENLTETEGGSCYTPRRARTAGSNNAASGKTDVSTATFAGVDLSGSDLRGVNFSNRNLSAANLSDTNLAGANLSNANLRGADLTDANLKEANLTSADFTGATMPRTFLKDADISGTKFDNAKLMGADMRGTTRTSSTSFTNANLSMVRNADVAFTGGGDNVLGVLVTPPVSNRMLGSTHYRGTLLGNKTFCVCIDVSCTQNRCTFYNALD